MKPLVLILLALAVGVAAFAHRALTLHVEPSDGRAPIFPNASVLRLVAAGYESAAADLGWLATVQYIGTESASESRWPGLYAMTTFVTDLDPQFGYAYQVGATLLALSQRYTESDRLLDKGMTNCPSRWQLPFLRGYNLWTQGGNLPLAARMMDRAARLPGSPQYLPLLTARLYASADDLEAAAAFVSSLLEQATDDQTRQLLAKRRDEILVEAALRNVESQIAEYQLRFGTRPADLVTLAQKLGKSLPGVELGYDPATGVVSSPQLPRRLNLAK